MPKLFGKALKKLRTESGKTQAQLALELGKSQKTIGNWETGFSEPSVDELVLLSNYFGVTLDFLLKGVHLNANFVDAGNVHPSVHPSVHLSAENEALNEKMPPGEVALEAEARAELLWRDKYINLLEGKMQQTFTAGAFFETLKALQSNVAAIQVFVLKLAAGGLSGEDGPIHSEAEAAAALHKFQLQVKQDEAQGIHA